jgi:hypothetical protein
MPKPNSLRGNVNAANGPAGAPMIIGVASGARPRTISTATYQDAVENPTISLRTNHFGIGQEVASPVDGTPLTRVEEPQDVSAADLFATTAKVGSCEFCATDLYADKQVASLIDGHQGHCVMCGHGVAFKAETNPVTAETPAANVEAIETVPGVALASDNTNRFAFDDMTFVNEEGGEPNQEEAAMTDRDKDRDAIVSALRPTVIASDAKTMDGEPEGDEDEDDTEEEDEEPEGESSEGGEENTDDAAGDAFADDVENDEESEGDDEGEDDDDEEENDEEANANLDAPPVVEPVEPSVDTPPAEVATTEEAPAPVVPTEVIAQPPEAVAEPVTVVANTEEQTPPVEEAPTPTPDATVTAADVAIDDYQAVDINTVDLTSAVIVPASETAAYVMIGAAPALYLDKVQASVQVQNLWHKTDSLRHALTAAMQTSTDRQATLASFGGEVVTISTSMRDYAKQKLDGFTAKAEAEVASMSQDYATRFDRAIAVAAMGTVKRSFGGGVDPLTTNLVAVLENNGVRQPQALVLAAMRDAMPALLKVITDKASELVLASDDVLSNTAEMVGNAAFPVELPEPAPIVEQPTTVTPEVAKPLAVKPNPVAVIETARVREVASPERVKMLVSSLGTRR